jgi:hypothetical protein
VRLAAAHGRDLRWLDVWGKFMVWCGRHKLTFVPNTGSCDLWMHEFAVFDGEGLVHPYARPIALRQPDGTRIRVTLGVRNGAIQARFQDQGVGISPEHLPFIFDRFYRAAPLNSGDAQSGGLGLAIAQAIAFAQGGTIECESTAGVGSTFTVTLPITHQETTLEITPKQKLILR